MSHGELLLSGFAWLGDALEQTIQVMACHGPVAAAVLEQKARQCGMHQAVLIPLGMGAHEAAHGLVEILGKFIDDAHVVGGVLGDLAHAR